MSTWTIVLLVAGAIGLGFELYDRFKKPLPWWRKVRLPVAGLLALVWAFLVFRKTEKPKHLRPKPVKPKEFDDTDHQKLDDKADNLDVKIAGSPDNLDDIAASNADLESKLRDL